MKIFLGQQSIRKKAQHAFTLIEALFAILLSGIMFTALYAGLNSGFRIIKMARENTRATQIMIEQMGTCRLFRWEKLTNVGGFLNTNPLVVPYYPLEGTNEGSLMFTSRVILEPVNLGGYPAPAYADNMRKLTVRVDWETLGTSNRSRSMSTYVSRNGLQNYVW